MANATGLWAQDFAPSQQAQGYLDSKNVSVDYATGLFHYKVPLYTLKSGDFELPLSINYVGKGVRHGDLSGLIGYNWSLDVGGVVTRTIRGGIADEMHNGYIHQTFIGLPTTEQIERVNKREIDGESDIFTAVFNGQSVNFIIKKENNKIVAEPLERTNVKIECEHTSFTINGWLITDENGDKFYFRQKERSVNVYKEDAISFNSVRNESFTSSWHISRIEPRNCEPIVYNYRQTISEVIQRTSYQTKYSYGRPMINRPFDFSKYQARFTSYIDQAEDRLGNVNFNTMIERSVHNLNRNFVRDPIFDIYDNIIAENHRVMGLLASFRDLQSASQSIISTLDALISQYSSSEYSMVRTYLALAKSTMLECLNEEETIDTQTINNGSSMRIKSPILDNINQGNKIIKFDYKSEKAFYIDNRSGSQFPQIITIIRYILSTINIEDIDGNNLMNINLDNNAAYLDQISFHGNDNIEIDRIQFDYYGNMGGAISDIWGFSKKYKSNIVDHQFSRDVDGEYAKSRSLSKITTQGKGEIMIDYESNVISSEPFSDNIMRDYGGIRIKSLTLRDPLTNQADSIKYIYPYPGELVFSKAYNTESLRYYYYGSYFRDELVHSRDKTQGEAIIKTGNNGVFYPYVEEEFLGKGKKTYLFFNPQQLYIGATLMCNFWMCGLPLGNAIYDNDGNLKLITKYSYNIDINYISISPFCPPSILSVYEDEGWFSGNSDTSTTFSQSKLQIKAYEYYMDYNSLSAYYSSQSLSTASSFSPYRDVFVKNIAPRTNITMPEQNWELIYGGKVLLKSKKEYQLEHNATTTSSVEHFIIDFETDVPCRKTEYFYDNLSHSTSPTRITANDAKGDKYTSITRRVADMNVPGILSEMKEHNILSPVVKQQNLINGKLAHEIIYVYDSARFDNKTFFGLAEERMYIPITRPTVSVINGMDNSLFQYNPSHYTSEKKVTYSYDNGKYFPTSIIDKADTLTYRYDSILHVPLLEARNYANNQISAINNFIPKSNHENDEIDDDCDNYSDIDRIYIEAFGDFKDLLDFIEDFECTFWSSPDIYKYIDYLYSGEMYFIKYLLETITSRFESITYNHWFGEQDWFQANPEFIDNLKIIASDYLESIGLDSSIYNPLSILMDYDLPESTYDFIKDGAGSYNTPVPEDDSEYIDMIVDVSQTANPHFRLYIVSKSFSGAINYTITHSSGISTGVVAPRSKPHWNIQALDIDLALFRDISSIEINTRSNDNLAYLTFIPSDCEFEATAYNSDGTVFCKFDQTGQMERYEYDGAGRVIKVFDGDRNLLKENTYNYIRE